MTLPPQISPSPRIAIGQLDSTEGDQIDKSHHILQMLQTNFSRFEETLNNMRDGMQVMQSEVNVIKQKVQTLEEKIH